MKLLPRPPWFFPHSAHGGTDRAADRAAGAAARAALPVALLVAVSLALGGCGIFGFFFGDDEAGENLKQAEEPPDPFEEGMLKAIGHMAPGGSPSQYLSRIAEEMGWEGEVAGNTLLRIAVETKDFAGRVEPFLYALFYKNGFSVLPQVGEGHQFSRDSLVRGVVETGTFLVTTREQVRIIFVKEVGSVQIVYPQDGVQPQIFSLSEKGIIIVRRSLLERYLR